MFQCSNSIDSYYYDCFRLIQFLLWKVQQSRVLIFCASLTLFDGSTFTFSQISCRKHWEANLRFQYKKIFIEFWINRVFTSRDKLVCSSVFWPLVYKCALASGSLEVVPHYSRMYPNIPSDENVGRNVKASQMYDLNAYLTTILSLEKFCQGSL